MHHNTSVDYLLHPDTHAIAECRREKPRKIGRPSVREVEIR